MRKASALDPLPLRAEPDFETGKASAEFWQCRRSARRRRTAELRELEAELAEEERMEATGDEYAGPAPMPEEEKYVADARPTVRAPPERHAAR